MKAQRVKIAKSLTQAAEDNDHARFYETALTQAKDSLMDKIQDAIGAEKATTLEAVMSLSTVLAKVIVMSEEEVLRDTTAFLIEETVRRAMTAAEELWG